MRTPTPASLAALAVASLFLIAPLLSVPAGAGLITTFADGSTSRTISFATGNGTNSATQIALPQESRVVYANAMVSTAGNAFGLGPSDVRVFVAGQSPSQQVWGFGGTGYGGLGTQTLYSDGSDTKAFDADGHAPVTFNTTIRLPYEANASFGMVRVDYGRYDAGFLPPVPLSGTIGTGFGAVSGQINMNGSGVPYLVDIDADGDLDLFSGGGFINGSNYRDSGPKCWRNTGSASNPVFWQDPSCIRYVDGYWYLRPALADLDGDGDYDISNMGGQGPGNAYVWFWKNTGTMYTPSFSWNGTVFQNFTTDPQAVPTYVDIDGDGDQDLVIGDSEGKLSLYQNVGSATRAQWQYSNLFRAIDVGMSAAPNFADYDGDGDFDLVIGNETDLVGTNWGIGTSMIRLWENTGSPTNPSFQLSDAFDGLPLPDNGNISRPAPFLADLDGDGDLDMVVADFDGRYWYYEGRASWPSNIVVDVGADGVPEATLPAGGPGYSNVTNLAGAINHYLDSLVFAGPPPTDAWGNAMVEVPLSITTQTDGLIWLHRLFIQYSYDAVTRDFDKVLDDARAGGTPDPTGMVSVPMIVRAATAGSLRLHGLNVMVDLAPTFIPYQGTIALDEDTHNPNLFNLSQLFVDDLTWEPSMNFSIVSNSQAGVIGVTNSGVWLDVDAATGSANDNWNGYVNVTVRATDERGLSTEGVIFVWVRPVNDAPVFGPMVTEHVLIEDEPWQLFPHAEDVDGDALTWTLSSATAGAVINASTGAIHWTPTSADVGDHVLTVTVSDGALSATVDLLLTVLPSNDPPIILPLPALTVEEGVPFTFDLAPYIVDDDPLSELSIMIDGAHVSLAGTVVSGTIPSGEGIQVEKVEVFVTDPDGEVAHGTLALLIVPAGPRIALVGVPDLQVVESVPKTLDVTPFIKNVKSIANVTLAADGPYTSVAGKRVTFIVPLGASEDSFKVLLTVTEGDTRATWELTVTVVRLGSTLLIADLPDMDVVAGTEAVISLSPHLHNVLDWGALTFETDSPRAWVVGTSLHLLYPTTFLAPSEAVRVTVSEGAHSSSDTLSVFVHRQGAVLTVDPLPGVTVLEGEPYAFLLTPYIHGADPLSDVTVGADSPYADTSGLSVTLLYPKGSGVLADHIVVTTHWRGQSFVSLLEVTVVPWQDAFLFGGVPNVIVVAGVPLTISLVPYLHNLGDQPASAVLVTTSSPRASVGSGPAVTFLYDASWEGRSEVVMLTAALGGVTREQVVEVRIRGAGAGLGLAPLPEQNAREDDPLAFDVAPFVLNAGPGGVEVITDSSFATTAGTVVTFLFPHEMGDVFVWVTVRDGTGVAQGLLIVHVEPVNDAPRVVGSLPDQTARIGNTVVFDLSQLFDDEESAGELVLRASDPRVTIDPVAKTASFIVPGEGAFEIVFTAIDPLDGNLTASAAPVTVTGTTSPTPQTVGSGLGWEWLILALVVVGGAVAYMRFRGRRPPSQ